jgi:hypothetical protein
MCKQLQCIHKHRNDYCGVSGFTPAEEITTVEIDNIHCARLMQHGNETADVAVHEAHGATASSNQTSTFQFKN